jgi:hypothetical protein
LPRQLLAEAADRSALGSPEAAAAQAEEAALFPQNSFAPLVPCAMVRRLYLCASDDDELSIHQHHDTP